MDKRLMFASDYMEGAHPLILNRLIETNMEKTTGYGSDIYTASAVDKIRKACGADEAEVYILTGGTQTNATVIRAMLTHYQGVIAARTGHINVHEAGAIEAGGHKVMATDHVHGKLSPSAVKEMIDDFNSDLNRDHMVMPGMVYISQPTEYGTLYSLTELVELSGVCRAAGIPLYIDGARLAYALACKDNDATLKDIARLSDAFYIGGTKCGALFGEAVVFPKPGTVPHFYTIVKQQGALLAKGRIAGIQFDTLFTDDLYIRAGRNAIDAADRIREALRERGYELPIPSPTNQIFVALDSGAHERLSSHIVMDFWERTHDNKTIMRIATSWATAKEDVDRLISLL